MPQLTHDTSEDGFHEIQLSGKQLFFLFMVLTVVSIVIFLTGVLVGRSVQANRETEAPVETAEALPLRGEAQVGSETPPGEPPAPIADPELSYHQRLQAQTPNEKDKELEKPQAQPEQAKPAAPPPAPAAAPPAEPKFDVPTSGRPGAWVIQVIALSNRDAASSIVKRLAAKGYPAFLLPPSGAPEIYRVQIGRYKDRREADQVARRLEKEEQFKPEIKR